jgi:hypothetical protein
MNIKRIIFVLVCVAMVCVLCQPIKACILVFEVTLNVEKVSISIPDPLICGLNCWDSAMAKVTCPRWSCDRSVVNGCPSSAECTAPKNPDGTRDAKAEAYGNCFIPRRWSGWIVLGGSGCTAEAKATASKNVTVTNITLEFITVGWRILWIPYHDFYWVAGFDSGVDGIVNITFEATDANDPNNPLITSTTFLSATSPDLVPDSTGLLMWERSPFYDAARGKLYPNAFRPVMDTTPIVLREYTANLGPGESIDLEYTLSTQSRLLEAIGPPETNLDVVSKAVGIEGACFDNVAGDLDGDCNVDFGDFAIFAEHWLQEGELL